MMPPTTDMQDETPRLDWREIVEQEEPVVHLCNCEHCDYVGEEEPGWWPSLTRMSVDGVDYVTDRYLAVRADLAPIPESYEGEVMETVLRKRSGFMAAAVLDVVVPPSAATYMTTRALSLTGWTLSRLAGEEKALAVLSGDGEHIGWSMRRTPRPGGDA